LVDADIKLSDYNISKDFKGNKTFSLGDATPDAIGLDLGLSGAIPMVGAQGGINLIWHTRGEKKGDAKIPEVKLLGNDNLRVYTSKDNGELFFCCDTCSYCENIKGERIDVSFPLLPARPQQIEENNINSYCF
jgi:hypothetical protein